MNVTLTGKIVAVLDKKTGVSKTSGKEWASQSFVLEDAEGTILCFDVFGQDNIDRYGLKVGMNVSAQCKLESREWNGKYFTGIHCMACFGENTTNAQPTATAAPTAQPKPQPSNDPTSDLPF